jgi:hypothetical protein
MESQATAQAILHLKRRDNSSVDPNRSSLTQNTPGNALKAAGRFAFLAYLARVCARFENN